MSDQLPLWVLNALNKILLASREFDLADHHRLDSVTPFHFGSGQSLIPTVPASSREVIKGTFINPDFAQLRIESAQKFVHFPVTSLSSCLFGPLAVFPFERFPAFGFLVLGLAIPLL